MHVTMPTDRPYEKQVFVCTYGPWCARAQSVPVMKALREAVKGAGIPKGEVRINKSGCLSQCGHGPMAVVYPEGVWYCGLKAEDAQDIVKDHLQGGVPVERLRYRPEKPGPNKTPEVLEAEAKEKAAKG